LLRAARFDDGAVVMADSRATWVGGPVAVFQDGLQKIISLGPRTGIAYAGDVPATELVIRQLRIRMRDRPRLQLLDKFASELPRITRHYLDVYRARTLRRPDLALILFGVTASGKIGIWGYEAPRFTMRALQHGYLVAGSGRIVESFLAREFERLKKEPDLKARADAMIIGFEDALQRGGIETVGGLFQIVMLDRIGIRPLSYHFIDVDPEGPPRARSIRMTAGRWIQTDEVRVTDHRLVEPGALLAGGPREFRFHEFQLPSPPQRSKWHLTYFTVCLAASISTEVQEFRGAIAFIGAEEFPLHIEAVAALGFWGSAGDHNLRVILELDDGRRQLLHEGHVKVEFLPEDRDVVIPIRLSIDHPGRAFIECWVEDQRLSRHAMYFDFATFAPPYDVSAAEKLAAEAARVTERARAVSDGDLESLPHAQLVYFVACQGVDDESNLLRFRNHFGAVYSREYPMKLRFVLATALRMSAGPHSFRVELVNAATRAGQQIANATIEGISTMTVSPIHGYLDVPIQTPGIYFLNLHIDGHLIATALLAAEKGRGERSYLLRDEDYARVEAGEVLVMVKRSRPATS
jgi:20S proteasome alpha/beta subunit